MRADGAKTKSHIPWNSWFAALAFGIITALLSLAFFNHARDEFADAL